MKVDANVDGLIFVIDPETKEFFLYTKDGSGGLISGQLGPDSKLTYNTGRGSQADGIFTGTLPLEGIPFRVATYPAKEIENLIKSNFKSQEEIVSNKAATEEPKPKKLEFEFYDPVEHASLSKPPLKLISRQKKKWYKERRSWLDAQKSASPVVETKEEVSEQEKIEMKRAEQAVEKVSTEAIIGPVVQPEIAKKELPKLDENPAKREEAKRGVAKAGQGQMEGTFENFSTGYYIGHYAPATQDMTIVATPVDESQSYKYLVFLEERQAKHCLEQLRKHPAYQKLVADGPLTADIYPVSSLHPSEMSLPVLAITNVYTFMSSPMLGELVK